MYIIPESHFKFCNTDRDKTIKTYKELVEDYCTYAKAVDGDMHVYLTEIQRYNLIERNDEYIDHLLDELKKKMKTILTNVMFHIESLLSFMTKESE